MKESLRETFTELKENADKVDTIKGDYDLTFLEYASMTDEPIEEIVRLAYNMGFTRGMKYAEESRA